MQVTVTTSLLKKLGIPYKFVGRITGPIWDGQQFTFKLSDTYGDIGRFHELMHYLVADEWQLREPDFGLGINADADITSADRYADEEDPWEDAGCLGSWGDEQRVTATDAGRQEGLSTYAMAIYSLLEPKSYAEVRRVLYAFSAWSPEDPWSIEDNKLIAATVSVPLGLDYRKVLRHLNKEMIEDGEGTAEA